jgi:hypothetical protein
MSRAMVGLLAGWAVGFVACYVYWLAIGAPTVADWTTWVGAAIWSAGAFVGYIAAVLGSPKGGA